MNYDKFSASKTEGIHAAFANLQGEWEGTIRTWFEPGKLADESPVTAEMRTVLGGRFLLHEYKSSLMGKAFEGMAIYGSDLASGKFQSAWIDGFHMSTAIMLSEGKGQGPFSVTGSYADPSGGPAWGWRTELIPGAENELTIRAYNITPDGEEALAMESVYRRKS